MSLDVDVLTIFPHMFPGPLGDSITGRALAGGQRFRELGLRPGVLAIAVVKATTVLVETPEGSR